MTLVEVGRREDAEARRLAQTVFDRPVVLEAGAGTGKTAALVARLLAWALGQGWDRAAAEPNRVAEDIEDIAGSVLDGIVAITFTEDAAAEMTRRVAEALGELQGDARLRDGSALAADDQVLTGLEIGSLPDDLATVQRRAAALLTVVERLRTSTIHAFARTLLSRFPVEAGKHPAFEVDADGRVTTELVEKTTEDLLEGAYRGGAWHAEALLLAARGLGPVDIRDAALDLVGDAVPVEALGEDPLASERVAPAVQNLFDALKTFVPAARRLADVDRRSTVTRGTAEWILDMARWEGPSSEATPSEQFVEIGAWIRRRPDWSKWLERLQKWGSKHKFSTGEERVFAEVSESEFDALRPLATRIRYSLAFDPEAFDALRRVLQEIVSRVEAEKRRCGVVVFQDLLVGARRLLEEHPAVLSILQGEIAQLSVDEMQDTDAEQAEIVRLLGLTGERPPGLFLVGDPKQSIYGWRKADMAIYRQLVCEVEAGGGVVRSLTVNFRSVQPVLDEVTRLIRPVMYEEEGLQPPFIGLLTGRQDEGASAVEDHRRPVEHWYSAGADENGSPVTIGSGEAAEMEAEAVAQDIAALYKDGVALHEIAIVMRSRSRQTAYLEALRRHGMPYVVGKDPNYYRTREVIEMVALIRVILDPFDTLALVAVLRSPMVGVPDAALRPLWRNGLPRRLMARDPEDWGSTEQMIAKATEEVGRLDLGEISLEALAGWSKALKRFIEALDRLRRSFDEDPPDLFVEGLRRHMLPEPLAAARYPGAYRLANVDRFFRELEEALGEGRSAEAVLRRLRRMERERPDESSGKPRGDVEGVRVMTIHGAKGLGFDHVYLVQTHASPGRTAGDRKSHLAETAGRWEMNLLGMTSAGWSEFAERRTMVEEAERVRLLYVAATRAKRRLVVVGNPLHRSKGPFAKLLDEREGGRPDLERLLSKAKEQSFFDDVGARWTWLGHPRRNERRVVPALTTKGPAVAFERLKTDAVALDEWAAAAREREAVPWLATASAETHRLFREGLTDRFEGPEQREAWSNRKRRVGPQVATVVGSALHSIFEHFAHSADDPKAELDRRMEDGRAWLEGALPPGDLLDQAKNHLTDIVEDFRIGTLWPRFLALAGSILARELPIVAPAELPAAVGAVTGAIDLVYRDSVTGEVVIADYKTDRLEGEEQLRERAALYRPQLEIYARTFQKAMSLEKYPRRELWFIAAGTVIEVE